MSPTLSRRLVAQGAIAAGVALITLTGCAPESADKNVSEVTASASASASDGATGGATDGATTSGLPEQVTVTTDDGVDVTITGSSVVLGDPAAPTQVVVYQDLACPHCKSLHDVIGTDLLTWAKSGSVAVKVITVDFLGRSSTDFSTEAANLLATVAAHDPASWIAVQDALFAAQGDAPSGAELAQLADDAGAELDAAAVEGFHEQAYDAFVDASTETALDAGIQSIPQVFVDGEAVTGADYEAWGEAIRAAVEASVNGG